MENPSVFMGILLFCNPVFTTIVLIIFSHFFYGRDKSKERFKNMASFLILGVGLVLSLVIPSLILMSKIIIGLDILVVMLLMLFSTFASIFYFLYSLRRTAKNSNIEKNNISTKGHNTIVLYTFSIVNVIILVRVFYYFTNKKFLDNGVSFFFILPEIFILISIIIIFNSEFMKKIYSISALHFSLALLRFVIQLLTGSCETFYKGLCFCCSFYRFNNKIFRII